MVHRRTLEEHLSGPGPKRILALDGGGVRGLISLGILKRVEAVLQARHGADLRLCDYFDLIGGTSTGALIATLLALGYDVERIIKLYHAAAPRIFRNRRWFPGIQAAFDSAALERAVGDSLAAFLKDSKRNPKDVDALRLNTEMLKTGLAVVCKRIDTGSVWVLTNNPKAKYWDPTSRLWAEHLATTGSGSFFPNSDYLLAKLVQASASAPYYLDGVEIRISEKETGHFLDGGVSPFNNPSQELFLMTTLKAYADSWNTERVSPYGFKWETGADKLYMLSVGTGTWRPRVDNETFKGWSAAYKALHALRTVLHDASVHSNIWLQAISQNPGRVHINGNLLDMQNLRMIDKPLLYFRRMDAEIEPAWLTKALGAKGRFSAEVLERTRQLDNPDKANLARLAEIGEAAGAEQVSEHDFPPEFDQNVSGKAAA